MKNIITILTTLIIVFFGFSNNALAEIWSYTESPIPTKHSFNSELECNTDRTKYLSSITKQKGDPSPCSTFTITPEAQRNWSYYRSSQRDLSGEVFADEASCLNASSNNPFANRSEFDSTWQNCFISDKNGKPLEGDEYSYQEINGPIPVTPKEKNKASWEKYTLLAPFAGFNEAPDNVGDYLNKIFIIGIALCGALAVVMLVIAGIQYMGEESISGKSAWRERMKNALYGLLIALSAYALLNTIDPRLLGGGGVNIRAVKAIIVNYPDAGDSNTDQKCKDGTATYSTNYGVSGGVASAIKKIDSGFKISKLEVDSKTNQMTIALINQSGILDRSSKISISPGWKGYAEINEGKPGDNKTPKGSWSIINKIETQKGQAVCNSKGSNMGAGFWRLSPTTNGERGIGIHGNENGTQGTTNGCIRITNADILALNPYVKTGLQVEIK